MNAKLNAAPTDLFDPVQVGDYRLANRIVMAPLTRSRAHVDGTANTLMTEYYAQRASAGLIIAEGTNISPQGRATRTHRDSTAPRKWRRGGRSLRPCTPKEAASSSSCGM